MASIVGKRVDGQTYYYVVTSRRVGGKPRIVSQEYLGSAASVADAVRSAGSPGSVARVRQRPYGDLLAVWRTIGDLRIAELADSLLGRQRASVSAGTYLAIAVAHRMLALPGETASAWWERAEVRRFVRARPLLERMGRAVSRVPSSVADLVGERARSLLASVDGRTLLVDDLRVTLDGVVPVGGSDGAGTVVLESGELGHRLPFVGSLPATDHPELLAVRPRQRSLVDAARFPGVTAFDTRSMVAGVDRRVILVHSANGQAAQARAFAQELSRVERRLHAFASLLSSDAVRVGRERASAEVSRITRVRWVSRVVKTSLTADLQLSWSIDAAAVRRLVEEVFGKQVLVTSRDDWPVADVLAAYRARFWLESTMRAFASPLDLVGVLAVTVAHLMRHRAHQAGLDLSVPELFATLAAITESSLIAPSTGGRPRVRRLLNELSRAQRHLLEVYN